ncbi:uncharacterized protein JCM6883_000510, partial [Sporobolomyces salmoneus]|uniref:uncharacterized protein n=1 Tax=Sporobolomyces salmoneus TaxID=183962 RepID=UPI0031729D87
MLFSKSLLSFSFLLPAALALTVPGGSSLPPSNEALPLEQRSTTPPASTSPDPSSSIGTNEQQPSSSSMNSRLSKRDPFLGGFGDFGDFDFFWKRQALDDLDSESLDADSLDESSSSTLAKR